MIQKFKSLILEYLFPSGCAVCGSMLLDKEDAWYGLCGDCRRSFKIEKTERCSLCGRPLISEQGTCLACRELAAAETLPAYDKLISLYPYSGGDFAGNSGSYLKLLGSYKFGKRLSLGRFFADKVYEALAMLSISESENPELVPVPPRPGKLRKTGWDQIEYLARFLKKREGEAGSLKVERCLKRLPSETQKKLDRETRKSNLKGRIVVKGKVPKTAVLFDDVITTGSTMDACAAALKESGTEKVYGICLFYD
ncbi:ComF family protein [Leadbettera azotonutricia]|uniref:Phosphoribosyltransferase n=1 Tax=Leadbettera azotonutricia (strain ATCC BAA-888 / DSM 13862 / ZAS-9) TaxID=545695 RepID=F5YBM7_LEAAZ|nr:double zinc ribbon domain-containing protein [Leadbettera azotonutricia]AEF81941.1 phosphoribosyltransferase [Leadbettera azotonutricia ZAS-9]